MKKLLICLAHCSQCLAVQEMTEPVPKPLEMITSPRMKESRALIRSDQARAKYGLDGSGLTVAVIDTGIRPSHKDFQGRIIYQKDFINGWPSAWDHNGHGSHITGTIAADGIHQGIAPKTRIIALKVLDSTGTGRFIDILAALRWVLENKDLYGISVVNMSIGDGRNWTIPWSYEHDRIRKTIALLRTERVAVVVPAGNYFYQAEGRQGMTYPGICPETVSAGAVYDADLGGMSYLSGAKAFSTAPDRITPFSQRYHESKGGFARTDIFAPGDLVTSTGISSNTASASYRGTSMSAPMTTGVILLMQQFYMRMHGELPLVSLLEDALRNGKVIKDGDDEQDNVKNTMLEYRRLDAMSSMEMIDQSSGPKPHGTLNFRKGQIRLDFRSPDKDKIKLVMYFNFSEIPTNRPLLLLLGQRAWAIGTNSKGKLHGAKGRVTLRRGRCTLSVRLSWQSLRDAWEDLGIKNEDVRNLEVEMPVKLFIDGLLYEGTMNLSYTAKKDKKGVARTRGGR